MLFNTWKHHAGSIRRALAEAAARGPVGVEALPKQLVVIGAELMDLYTGTLAPAEIASRLLSQLVAEGRLTEPDFRDWIAAGGGYRMLELAEDGSRWTLRHCRDGDRYVHIHPGRWSPGTRRVRANVLKSAIMVLAHAAAHGGDPFDVALVNAARQRYLGLLPVQKVSGDEGLGVVIAELRNEG